VGEASLRFTQVRRFGGTSSSDTQYLWGANSRREYRELRGTQTGPLRATIHNRDLAYLYQLDLEAGVYTATRVNEFGAPVGTRPPQMERKKSGRERHIHTDTVDTGERREMFGYQARRIITRTTERYEPEDARPQSESELDGWYIDPPEAWLRMYPPHKGRAYFSVVVNGVTDEVKFTDAGERETGFPLAVTRTHHTADYTSVHREEVTDFSEDDLDPALFVPTANSKRVAILPQGVLGQRYPFGVRFRLHWELLKDRLRQVAR